MPSGGQKRRAADRGLLGPAYPLTSSSFQLPLGILLDCYAPHPLTRDVPPYQIGNGWFGGFVPTKAFAMVASTGDSYYGLCHPIAIAQCFVNHRRRPSCLSSKPTVFFEQRI